MDIEEKSDAPMIRINKNGPFTIIGFVPLYKETIISDMFGVAQEWRTDFRFPDKQNRSLCRCGKTTKNPYCDGSHTSSGFDGTEKGDYSLYHDKAEKFEGADITLLDRKDICADARFCDQAGGTWKLVDQSSDPTSKKIALEETFQCPSGRLVMQDKKSGEDTEPALEKSISIVEDPGAEASGPLWVKGGIPIQSSEGVLYETRNRVTLCRCGNSENKPFCDGKHIVCKFNDGML